MAGTSIENPKKDFSELQKKNILDQLENIFSPSPSPSSSREDLEVDLKKKADLLFKIASKDPFEQDLKSYLDSVEKNEIKAADSRLKSAIKRFLELIITNDIRKNNKKTLGAVDLKELVVKNKFISIVAILWPIELLHAIAQKLKQSKNLINVQKQNKKVDVQDLKNIEQEFLDYIQRKFDQNRLENFIKILALIPNAHLKTEGLTDLDPSKKEQIQKIKEVFPIIPRFILDHDPDQSIKNLLQMIENSFKPFIIPEDWNYLSETIIKPGSQAYSTDLKVPSDRKIPIKWPSYYYNGLEPEGQAKYIADTIGENFIELTLKETSSNLDSDYTQIIQLIQGYKKQDTEAFFLNFAQYCSESVDVIVNNYGQKLNQAYITDLMQKRFLSCSESENNQDFIKIPKILFNDLIFYIKRKYTEIFKEILEQTGLEMSFIKDPKEQFNYLKLKFQSDTIADLFSKIQQQKQAYRVLQKQIDQHTEHTVSDVNGFFTLFKTIHDDEKFKNLLKEAQQNLISNLQSKYAAVFQAENTKLTNLLSQKNYSQDNITYIKALPSSKDLLGYLQEEKVKTYVDLLTQLRTKVQSPQQSFIEIKKPSSNKPKNYPPIKNSYTSYQETTTTTTTTTTTRSTLLPKSIPLSRQNSILFFQYIQLFQAMGYDVVSERSAFILHSSIKQDLSSMNKKQLDNLAAQCLVKNGLRLQGEDTDINENNISFFMQKAQVQFNSFQESYQNIIINNIEDLYSVLNQIDDFRYTCLIDPYLVDRSINNYIWNYSKFIENEINFMNDVMNTLNNVQGSSGMSSFNIINTNITERLLLLLKLPKYIPSTNEMGKTYNDTLEKVTAKVLNYLKTHQVRNTPTFDENYQILIQLFTEVKQTNHKNIPNIRVINQLKVNLPIQPTPPTYENQSKKFSNNLNQLWRTTSPGTQIPITVLRKGESLV